MIINLHLHCTAVQSIALGQWFQLCIKNLSITVLVLCVLFVFCGTIIFSLNFIRLLRVIITPSVTSLLRGENDSKQSDEFQAI